MRETSKAVILKRMGKKKNLVSQRGNELAT